jgi:Ca-activated chloride channel homolog
VPWRALLAVVAAVVVGLVVVQAVRSALGPTAAASCPIPQELIVLTTPTKEASVRQLAVAFGDQAPGSCRRSSIPVFSVPSASSVAVALAAGWPPDDLRLGPQPAVWLPDATAEVERVILQAGDDLTSLGSTATSPVVLAMPRSVKARLGDTSKVPWRTMVGWAKQDAPGPRLRIGRPDPASSTAGLLATIGLNVATSGSATPYTQRHAVERTIDRAADELTELCELGQPGGPARAVIVPEQAMVAYNRGARLGGSCAAGRQRSDRLAAVYAADGTPVPDHPFALLPASVELEDREWLARDFLAYLTSEPAQKQLQEAGFRDGNRRVGGTVGEQDGVLVHDPPTWARPPDGATLVRELDAWQQARLPARALLAMDVSGSMTEELPGPGGQRITAARAAAAQAVDLMGDRDQIGLWRFSQTLDGPRDYQERVPLGPAGDERRRERVIAELERLKATPRDTGLYDTIYAGIGHLRAGSASADAIEALVVVTDGKNDDPNGGVGLDAVRRRLDDGDEVLLFLLTFGPARCDAGKLGQLSQNRERVRCLDADRIGLERAFEQVAATLWGTARLAAKGGG